MPLLRLIVDGKEVKRCEISTPTVVGRGEECDLRIVDAQVSRMHCRIEPAREGWVVVDLGSHNGTLLAGKPIDRQVLRDGDQLEVGSAILQFETARLSAELAALQKEIDVADREVQSETVGATAGKLTADDTRVGLPAAAPASLWKHAQRRSLVPAPPPGPAARELPPGLRGRSQALLRSLRRLLSIGADERDHRDQPWYRRRISLPVGLAIALVVTLLLYFLVFGFPTLGGSKAQPPHKLPHSSSHNND